MESIERLRGMFESNVVQEAIDEIEREIAERYVELPLLEDGAIKVGDIIESNYGDDEVYRRRVSALILTDRWDFQFDLDMGDTRNCESIADFYENSKHAKSRTIEDVLRDFADKVENFGYVNTQIAKYAYELRQMGVGE